MRIKRHEKLRAVTRHEYLTIVKQPGFWVSMLIIPVFGLFGFAASYFSGMEHQEITEKVAKNFEITVLDQSGLVREDIAQEKNVQLAISNERDTLIKNVRTGDLDGLIIYPKNITETRSYLVYVDKDEKNKTDKESYISKLGSSLLEASILAPIGEQKVIRLVETGAKAHVTTYKNGEETLGFAAYIVPGFFLVLFYIVFFFSVGYAMTSVAEEKENRAIEMVLSYVRPRTLMTGKLFAVALVALTQLLFFIALGIIAYFLAKSFGNALTLPFELSALVFQIQPILFGVLYCIIGFLLFVALMLATGAAFPSAKEASAFMVTFYILALSPYFFSAQIIDTPHSLFLSIMTYFPLTSAQTLLLRNTVGSLSLLESLLGLLVIVLSTTVAVWLAGRIFKISALNFESRVSIKNIFRK